MLKSKLGKIVVLCILALCLSVPVFAAEKPIKVALIASTSGALEQYGKQTVVGFMMGLEYLTNGTMKVLGRPIEVLQRDDQLQPALSKQLLIAAYKDDKVDIAVGPTSSAAGMALLDVPKEFKKILIVEPAVTDEITGPKGNDYIFKTARNSSQDAIANAVAIAGPDVYIATLAQDYTFGHAFVASFEKACNAKGAKIVHKEFLPTTTQDFTPAALRIIDALKDKPGKKYVFMNWAGKGSPLNKMKDMQVDTKYGIGLTTGGNIIPVLKAYKAFPGMTGAGYYYHTNPKNKMNDWFVSEHKKRYNNMPPDFFTCGGFAAAAAMIAGINKAKSVDSEKLKAAMSGMHFQTPKGEMVFRKSDQQALQSMFVFKLRNEDGVDWAIPELVKELTWKDMDIPSGR
ncbi:MAG TPA: substrate-binding domain-containing protein [Smithellaceae bacterium]|nr:substrate-binding domain-containing protein [Smithellaceae bacterium]